MIYLFSKILLYYILNDPIYNKIKHTHTKTLIPIFNVKKLNKYNNY